MIARITEIIARDPRGMTADLLGGVAIVVSIGMAFCLPGLV